MQCRVGPLTADASLSITIARSLTRVCEASAMRLDTFSGSNGPILSRKILNPPIEQVYTTCPRLRLLKPWAQPITVRDGAVATFASTSREQNHARRMVMVGSSLSRDT